MKTRGLILLVVLGFGSLAASRVMDDDAMLKDPDKYNPHPPQKRMVKFTDKVSGREFCVYNGKITLSFGGPCQLEETPTDRVNRQVEEFRKKQAESARLTRLRHMTGEELFQYKEKKRRELLSGPRIVTRWDVASTH